METGLSRAGGGETLAERPHRRRNEAAAVTAVATTRQAALAGQPVSPLRPGSR